MHVVVVDDHELLAQGRAEALRRAGHTADVLTFDEALVRPEADWAAIDRAVVDASDTRPERLREEARRVTGAVYDSRTTFLGVEVVCRLRRVALKTEILVITAYAEPDAGNPLLVETLVQAGAHYILPHSDVHRPEDFVAEVEAPSPKHAAAPLDDTERAARRLRIDPGHGDDLLSALHLMASAPVAAQKYLLDGLPMSHREVKPHERQVRSVRAAVEGQLIRNQVKDKSAPLLRELLRHLLPPRR